MILCRNNQNAGYCPYVNNDYLSLLDRASQPLLLGVLGSSGHLFRSMQLFEITFSRLLVLTDNLSCFYCNLRPTVYVICPVIDRVVVVSSPSAINSVFLVNDIGDKCCHLWCLEYNEVQGSQC